MTDTINQTLRLPPDLAALLDQAANEYNESRHAFILRALRKSVQRPANDDFDPDLRLGFVELHGGEIIASEVDCPKCGCPLERPHLGFLAGKHRPIPYGPVCFICATTD